MADDFVETDLDTPTEADVAQMYGTRFLGVDDISDRKIRTKILKVRKEEVRDRDTGRARMRLVVYFDGIEKPLTLNVINKNTLVDALGKAPANWIGAAVGIYVDPNVTFAGQRKGGVRLKILLPPTKAKAAPQPTATAAATPWSEQAGDPGFDPALNDTVPDFGTAQ